ncbi:MAG: TetR/AcrR family transcriptional regulator [bacterium]
MSGGNGTREVILEAASDLFSQDEYLAVSMEELARRASVAKGTLYHHFGSKEALFQALTRDRSRRMLSMLERVIAGEDPVEGKLRSLTVHTFMFFVKYPAFFRLWEKSLAGGPSSRTAPFEEMRGRLREMIQRVICSGMAEGVFRPVSPDTAADVLFGAVMGAVPRCLELGVEDPCTLKQREQLFDFVWEAVRSRPVRDGGPPPAEGPVEDPAETADSPAGGAA